MASKTVYLSEPMVRALIIALAHGRLYPNRGEHLILGAWGEDVITVRDASGAIVQQGEAFELAKAPLTTVPPNTFDALVRRRFLTENGDITETGKVAVIALVLKVGRADAFKEMANTAEFYLNYMEQRSTEAWANLRATAMDTTDPANSSSVRRSRRPKI